MPSFRLLRIALLALSFVACSNDSPPTQPEDPNSIEAQIRALFQPGATVRDAALSQLAAIRQDIASGAGPSARTRALALVDFTMTSFREGRLIGGTSEATGNSVSKLVDAVYQLVGLDPPRIPNGALSNDGEARVVGPSGGQVVTPSGAAGVVIPPGALNENVLLTVTRLPNTAIPGTGPLPTTLKQYPPYYNFSTYPNVAQFGDSMRVGVCQVTDAASPFYPPEPHERLRLAHSVGTSIEILERVNVNDFLTCAGTSPGVSARFAGPTRARALSSLATSAFGLLRPRDLYAAHGGLGGKVRSFSPFAAVLPADSVFSGSIAQTGSVSYTWIVTPACTWTTFLSNVTFRIVIQGQPGVDPTFNVVQATSSATNFESRNLSNCSPPFVGTPQNHSFTGSRSVQAASITIDLPSLPGNQPITTLRFSGTLSSDREQIVGELTWTRIDQSVESGLAWILSAPITLTRQ